MTNRDQMLENTRGMPARSLRVAHVGKYAPESATGPSKAITAMLKYLPRYDVQVELWHFDRRCSEVTWRDIDGIPVLHLPKRRRHTGFLIDLPRRVQDALIARSVDVDLVHFHSVFIAENVRAASLLSVPYVISPRGGYNRPVLHGRNRFAKTIWLAAHERRYISSARALHAVSPAEAFELEEFVPTERIFCVPNGIDPQVLERPMRDPTEKTLLYLGRLAIHHKGIDLLLEGYAEFLTGSGDTSSQLIIAGPDFRGDRRRIEQQIRLLGLQDRVSLPGSVFGEDKWSLIDRAHAFVLTSRWEGMPFALLEALAAGRPALVTPETNLGDLITRYGAGIEVDADAHQIAVGIERLLSLSAQDRARMKRQAQWLIRERFTWERVIGQLASHYRRIVG